VLVPRQTSSCLYLAFSEVSIVVQLLTSQYLANLKPTMDTNEAGDIHNLPSAPTRTPNEESTITPVDNLELQSSQGNPQNISKPSRSPPFGPLCTRPRKFYNTIHQAYKLVLTFIDLCEDHWGWEVSGCCLAMVCLIAIIVILAVNHSAVLSEHDNISINTWISIFTAVMKAAITLVIAEGML
jgi:hypothetical protein